MKVRERHSVGVSRERKCYSVPGGRYTPLLKCALRRSVTSTEFLRWEGSRGFWWTEHPFGSSQFRCGIPVVEHESASVRPHTPHRYIPPGRVVAQRSDPMRCQYITDSETNTSAQALSAVQSVQRRWNVSPYTDVCEAFFRRRLDSRCQPSVAEALEKADEARAQQRLCPL